MININQLYWQTLIISKRIIFISICYLLFYIKFTVFLRYRHVEWFYGMADQVQNFLDTAYGL